jgi:hypothetical protein
MYRLSILLSLVLGQVLARSPANLTPRPALSNPNEVQSVSLLDDCRDFAWSSEEDFISQASPPSIGDPIISDGDLLSESGTVCMRNAELLVAFEVTDPMGLDAVDVLDVDEELVAFSTELNHPKGRFKHGDLLSTWGTVIPNRALLYSFEISEDRGLDAVHFIGSIDAIVEFQKLAVQIPREEWLAHPDRLSSELQRREIDIWFSIEGTANALDANQLLDGDVLSAATGTIIIGIDSLLLPGVPAGIPLRGVDFGVDALTSQRDGTQDETRFSTEILYRDRSPFTDGDILRTDGSIDTPDHTLSDPFEPLVDFVGTDALYWNSERPRR